MINIFPTIIFTFSFIHLVTSTSTSNISVEEIKLDIGNTFLEGAGDSTKGWDILKLPDEGVLDDVFIVLSAAVIEIPSGTLEISKVR